MRWALVLIFATASFGAGPPGRADGGNRVPPIFAPPPSQTGVGTSAAIPQPPPGPSNWQRTEESIDRMNGRILDDQLYEVTRLQRLWDEQMGRVAPLTDFQWFQAERDRYLRIQERIEQQQRMDAEQKRRMELDRQEYEMLKSAALPTASLAQIVDRQALDRAKETRDSQIAVADRARAAALQDKPENRRQIDTGYQQRLQQITEQYDRERERIFGYPVQPSTQPAN